MKHTTNFALNQWEKDDRIQMEDFNANNAKIDAALTQLKQDDVKIVMGSYVGTGTSGPDNPNTLDFAGTLGKAPALLYITDPDTFYSMLLMRGVTNQTCSSYPNHITWTETGLSWYCSNNNDAGQMNHLDTVYLYFAIG